MVNLSSKPVAKPVSLRQSAPDDDDSDEVPLDPAIERIRQRLRRLILVSSITLLVGLGAVLVAVIYKIGRADDKGILTPVAGETTIAGALPAGGHVVSTALDGKLLAVTYEFDGATRIVVIDLGTGRVLRRALLAGGALPATP